MGMPVTSSWSDLESGAPGLKGLGSGTPGLPSLGVRSSSQSTPLRLFRGQETGPTRPALVGTFGVASRQA